MLQADARDFTLCGQKSDYRGSVSRVVVSSRSADSRTVTRESVYEMLTNAVEQDTVLQRRQLLQQDSKLMRPDSLAATSVKLCNKGPQQVYFVAQVACFEVQALVPGNRWFSLSSRDSRRCKQRL